MKYLIGFIIGGGIVLVVAAIFVAWAVFTIGPSLLP